MIFNPEERARTGSEQQGMLQGVPAAVPSTPTEAALRDFVYAEVWSRPGLERRARFLIAIATAACCGAARETLEGYLRGALRLGELTLGELREGALHVAVYAGWGRARVVDDALTRIAAELDLPPVTSPPIQSEARSEEQRLDIGRANYEVVTVSSPPPPVTPYFQAGILNFVFGEMWMRPGLDQRSRRWITLACVADSSATTPIRSHTYSALASGDVTLDELQEFVLQYAVDAGWPKASVMQGAAFEMGKRVAEGLPFE